MNPEIEDSAAQSLGSRLRGLLVSPAMRQRVIGPMGFDASVLALNLITGIAIARALGPSGRGEIAAILLLTQMAGWLFSVGSTEAVSYRLARNPSDGGRLISSWGLLTLLFSLVAIAVVELVLPIIFGAQTAATIELARIYILVVTLMIALSVVNGILLGDHDFLLYNLVRIVTPAWVAVAYIVFWASGGLSVELALTINATAFGAACLLGIVRSVRRHGLDPPSRSLLRETLWYGLRAHGGSVAGLVNARLDLLIVPAFFGAASVGLYSVATNVGGIIGTLTGTIALLVLPVAARRQGNSARTVIRTMHVVLLIGLAAAVPLMALADIALRFVYGDDFGAAATSLRILLPGEVLDAAAMVLWSGLLAANRPFLSSIAAAPAAVVTVAGLVLFLESGGIEAAAIVSTTAYTLVFLISIFLYRHVAELRWRDFVHPPA
ncbi:MAG TPA: oligosaccharide flippase family protein [Solirubrobacterales bacterium]|nr:oligosaccharide flippase family protein [Solirubrobacterales bacterium]